MDKILILGAGGQIGVELAAALRLSYGTDNVIATDIRDAHPLLKDSGPYQKLDATDAKAITEVIRKEKITQVYLLAAILSATGEKNPLWAWDINMRSLMQMLEIGREEKLSKIYWPSSIAVFGPTTPRTNTPQHTIVEPATVYGISKYSGELWCKYYYDRYGLDVRGLRYPGLVSYKGDPGGGTTDYAVDIYHEALKHNRYTCFLKEDTYLPMMYMEDAIRATLELMEAPAEKLSTRMAYNVSAMSFCPTDMERSIQKVRPDFTLTCEPDFRQKIANGWPQSIDDNLARKDWDWQPKYDLDAMTVDMLTQLGEKLDIK